MVFLKKYITFVLGFLPGVFFLIVAAALTFLATKGLDWGYVTATDIDTYAFLGGHQRILEGLASGNIKQTFTYAFYNYGNYLALTLFFLNRNIETPCQGVISNKEFNWPGLCIVKQGISRKNIYFKSDLPKNPKYKSRLEKPTFVATNM